MREQGRTQGSFLLESCWCSWEYTHESWKSGQQYIDDCSHSHTN